MTRFYLQARESLDDSQVFDDVLISPIAFLALGLFCVWTLDTADLLYSEPSSIDAVRPSGLARRAARQPQEFNLLQAYAC